MKFKDIIDLLEALAPYALGAFVVLYGWLKIHYPDVAKKLEALDTIAENAYNNQTKFDDKTGDQKFAGAVLDGLAQAQKAHIHTTKANMAGAIQKAYNNNNPAPADETSEEPEASDAPVEVKQDE